MTHTVTPSDDLPDWPAIKSSHPELAARLMAGDLDARVEFVRLALGGTIISVEKR